MTKVALIWGAAGGIGRALARKLRDEGWQVIGVSRQGDDLAGVADHAFAADVADPFAVGLAGNAMNMVATVSRVDNSVEYTTPRVGGFSADVLYGFGEVAGDTAKSHVAYDNGKASAPQPRTKEAP